MTRPGFFVVIEGPEGAGKSTLAGALAARMRAAGVDPVVVREPGGTPVAEAIRRELLDPARQWLPETELLYFATARADLVAKVIRPALEAGRVVLSDRFDLSTAAYQIGGRGLSPERVSELNRSATSGLRADLTLVLDLSPEAGEARQIAAGKARDRIDRESREFHRRVGEIYRSASGEGFRHLDATLPPEQLLHLAWVQICEVRPETFREHSG